MKRVRLAILQVLPTTMVIWAERTPRGVWAALWLLLVPVYVGAQTLEGAGTVATGLLLRQMDGVKRVLMIGAHPDDEDSGLLAAVARGYGAQTAYLSLTRGEGGQNLIGPELWDGLGIIRTGELESARRLDGGRQFFTRAFDFGFSKTADEALSLWPRQELLSDVVWIVRLFRPHVIVSVFSGTPADGHGQHQAAGIMAREVFAAAADPTRYPEHFAEGVQPWQPTKLYQRRWRRRGPAPGPGVPGAAAGGAGLVGATAAGPGVLVKTGMFDPLLGRSHYQLAMEARSFHRSQNMGAPQPLGPHASIVDLVESRVSEGAADGLFTGVDTTLLGLVESLPVSVREEVTGHLEEYRASLATAGSRFAALDPDGVAGMLGEGLTHLRATRAMLESARPETSRELDDVVARRERLATRAILSASGVVLDVRADDDVVVPGQTVEVVLQLWNGGSAVLGTPKASLSVPEGWAHRSSGPPEGIEDGRVEPGALAVWRFEVEVPEDAAPSELYYLARERDGEMYRWPDEHSLRGLPRDPPLLHGAVQLRWESESTAVSLRAREPARYMGVNPARGQFERPVLVVPDVSAAASPARVMWPQGSEGGRTIAVAVRAAARDGARGRVRLEAPDGWSVTPVAHAFDLSGEGEERTLAFEVRPVEAVPAGDYPFDVVVTDDDERAYREGFEMVDYEHIERAPLFSAARANVHVIPVRIAERTRVGYVMGTGDVGALALSDLGADVEMLGPDRVREGDFDTFDALVLGVRAYEVREDLVAANAQLLDFVRQGGTLVVQYNRYAYGGGAYTPWPVSMSRPHDRVTDEDAPVRMLEPDAPLLSSPNRITDADFEGWTQERGLYFLAEWDDELTPLLEMNDPGEAPLRGSLLVAPLGEGVYVYAALSFFRQLPCGVPGAYRLLANLVSLRGDEWRAYLEGRPSSGR